MVEIVLSVDPPPPSRPRAGRTRTWTTRTPAARISTARAANSARLGSSRLCLVQLRTQRSGGGLLGGAVGRSTPGVRRAPRLPLPPPRLVVCSHAALLRGPPPRCVSCAGPPRRFSSLVLCLSSARAQFGSCGLLLLASAGLLGVQRPGCVLARGAAPRPAPSLRLPRVAASSFCSACFRCGQRARCAFCVPSPIFFKQPHLKILCWFSYGSTAGLPKLSPPAVR